MDRRDFLKLSLAYGASQTMAFGFDGTQMGLASGVMGAPHHRAKARRIIYLYMAGGPSQFETFNNKPEMARWAGKDIPKEILGDQRLTGMSGNQSSLPVAASPYRFKAYGESGIEVSELLPYTAGTTCASSTPCTAKPSITAPRTPSCRPARKLRDVPRLAPGCVTDWAATTPTCPPSW